MKKITIVFLAACVVSTTGCHWVGIHGNGHIKTDERPVSAFANIDIRGAFTVDWQSGVPSLSITTDENLLPYVDSNVSGDTLHLRTREQIRPTHGIRVVILSPTRAGARISGAVKLAANELQTKTSEISTTGASDAKVAVAETLKVVITGAGTVKYSGNPATIQKHISGAGSVRHRD